MVFFEHASFAYRFQRVQLLGCVLLDISLSHIVTVQNISSRKTLVT